MLAASRHWRVGWSWLPAGVLAAALGALLPGQTQSVSQGPHRLEITLEKREGAEWRAVDPRLVFQPEDQVRFRARTNFAGYLYVMNHSTSGQYTTLFPGEETGRQNQVAPGRDYLVPATQGSFRITGPPGHEIVYWLFTPVELGAGGEGGKPDYVPLPPPPKQKQPPPNLVPRCDETILRARGDCVDIQAGPKPLPEGRRRPENLAGAVGAASRDLVFVRRQNASVIAAPATLAGPVIFEFRLAHR